MDIKGSCLEPTLLTALPTCPSAIGEWNFASAEAADERYERQLDGDWPQLGSHVAVRDRTFYMASLTFRWDSAKCLRNLIEFRFADPAGIIALTDIEHDVACL
jgi:hypothetical protein